MAIVQDQQGNQRLSVNVSFIERGQARVRVLVDLTAPLSAQDRTDIGAAIVAALQAARQSRVVGIKSVLADLTRAEKDDLIAEAQK